MKTLPPQVEACLVDRLLCTTPPPPRILYFRYPPPPPVFRISFLRPISNYVCTCRTNPGERKALAEGATAGHVPALLPAVPILLHPAVGGGAVRRNHPEVPRLAGGAAAVPRHRGAPCPGEPAAGFLFLASRSSVTVTAAALPTACCLSEGVVFSFHLPYSGVGPTAVLCTRSSILCMWTYIHVCMYVPAGITQFLVSCLLAAPPSAVGVCGCFFCVAAGLLLTTTWWGQNFKYRVGTFYGHLCLGRNLVCALFVGWQAKRNALNRKEHRTAMVVSPPCLRECASFVTPRGYSLERHGEGCLELTVYFVVTPGVSVSVVCVFRERKLPFCRGG